MKNLITSFFCFISFFVAFAELPDEVRVPISILKGVAGERKYLPTDDPELSFYAIQGYFEEKYFDEIANSYSSLFSEFASLVESTVMPTAMRTENMTRWQTYMTSLLTGAQYEQEKRLNEYQEKKLNELTDATDEQVDAVLKEVNDYRTEINSSYSALKVSVAAVNESIASAVRDNQADAEAISQQLRSVTEQLNLLDRIDGRSKSQETQITELEQQQKSLSLKLDTLSRAISNAEKSAGSTTSSPSSVDIPYWVYTNNIVKLRRWLGYVEREGHSIGGNIFALPFRLGKRESGRQYSTADGVEDDIFTMLNDYGVVNYRTIQSVEDQVNDGVVHPFDYTFMEYLDNDKEGLKTNVWASFDCPKNWSLDGDKPDDISVERFVNTTLNPITNLAIKGFYKTSARGDSGNITLDDITQNNEDASGANKYDILVRKTSPGAQNGDTNAFDLVYVKPQGTYSNVLDTLQHWMNHTKSQLPKIEDDATVAKEGANSKWNAANPKNPRNAAYYSNKENNEFWKMYARGDADAAEDISSSYVKMKTIWRIPDSSTPYGNSLSLYGLWNCRSSNGKYLRPYVEKDSADNATEMTLAWKSDFAPDDDVYSERTTGKMRTICYDMESLGDKIQQISLYGFGNADNNTIPVKEPEDDGEGSKIVWKPYNPGIKVKGNNDGAVYINATNLIFEAATDSDVRVTVEDDADHPGCAKIKIGVYWKE